MNTEEKNRIIAEWIPVDMNNLPPELQIVEWKHPEYGIIKGSLVIYHPNFRDGNASTSYWVFPDPESMGHSADIWVEEFTHYRRCKINHH